MAKISLRSPIFVALDVDDDVTALKLANDTAEYVGGFKIGPRLTYKYGASFVKRMSEIGPIFVDNKYHDIPSTMIAALKATFESGASFATVHSCLGVVALRELEKLEVELNQIRPFQILAVTVLTSLTDDTVPSLWKNQPIADHVEMLTRDVIAGGLSGLVCSPHEVAAMRKLIPQGFLVTPGIRLVTGEDDQSRVAGPREALEAGASALVVGRPIIQAQEPKAAARKFYELAK